MTAFPYNITRADWEEPGHRISEHTNSPPLDWSKIRNVTLHYPGTPHTITAESATRSAFISNLRSTQRYYENERGYSNGYNAGVWGPLTAEIRGEAFRCAANGTTATNTPSFAVQIRAGGIEDKARAASDDEIQSVRRIVAWAESEAGRRLEILGHQDHKSTGCPGDAIYAQIQAGVFRPDAPTKPDPEVPTVTRYFKTPASPYAVWRTDNNKDAHRVEPAEFKAAGNPATPQVGEAEAKAFRYWLEIHGDVVNGSL